MASLFKQQQRSLFVSSVFDILFHGAYTVLFGLYVYLQVQQKGRRRYYLEASLLLLYMLSTASITVKLLTVEQINLTLVSNNPVKLEDYIATTTYMRLNIAAEAIYIAANFIADTLLLYRCYIVWSSRKWVIAVPIMISIGNTVAAIVNAFLKQRPPPLTVVAPIHSFEIEINLGTSLTPFLAINLPTNILLTGLIAGRLWWVSRTAYRSLGFDTKGINGIVALILESGLLYPIALIVGLVIEIIYGTIMWDTTMMVNPLLTVMVGIASTLIMVGIELRTLRTGNASNIDIVEAQSLSPLNNSSSASPPQGGEESLPVAIDVPHDIPPLKY